MAAGGVNLSTANKHPMLVVKGGVPNVRPKKKPRMVSCVFPCVSFYAELLHRIHKVK
jgi:hypothetical protein